MSEQHPAYIPRPKYQKVLEASRGLPLIKVVTGMRRCGKSVILEMFIDSLREGGVPGDRIYYRRFDQEMEEDAPDHRGLIDSVKESVPVEPGTFIFLDEVQDVREWERAVESFFTAGADVYVTGSNADLLSSELSTRLSGRYVEMEVLPLTFTEFTAFRRSKGDESGEDQLLESYLTVGGLPLVALIDDTLGMRDGIIDAVFNTVYVKDVIRRNQVRDEALMGHLNRFLMRNTGHRTSVRAATNYLNSKGYKSTVITVDNYISYLESALLFHRARRMDSKTKEYLRTFDKYYCNDLGIRNVIVGTRPEDMEGILENIVYMELRFRYGKVDVCDVEGREIDFCIWTPSYKGYYQVTFDLGSPDTLRRETASLMAVRDNYPKFIITYMRYPLKEVDGVTVIQLLDWLKS